jgi:hypothetical protein
MPADPKDSSDPRRTLRAIFTLRDGLRAFRLLLGLVVLLFISSLVGAGLTADLRSLYLHMALWCIGQCTVVALCVLALRRLRTHRFGALPSPRIRDTGDVLLHVDAVLGGLLALLGFLPRILAARPEPLDWIIVALGVALLIAGLRGALLHVLRP